MIVDTHLDEKKKKSWWWSMSESYRKNVRSEIDGKLVLSEKLRKS